MISTGTNNKRVQASAKPSRLESIFISLRADIEKMSAGRESGAYTADAEGIKQLVRDGAGFIVTAQHQASIESGNDSFSM